MNSQHLSPDDLILNYYGELDSRPHLDACEQCRTELARLGSVLDRVTPPDVPEPDADYEARVWNRLQWRLPSEKKRRPKSHVMRWAAVVVMAFLTGLIITKTDQPEVTKVAEQPAQPNAKPVAATGATQVQRDRILFVVVGDHFDQSERVLVELTNLNPASGSTDITTERERAEELLASNRLYRRTALDRGEENVATLLDELEPVLMQIAHAPSQVSANELRKMQKRVEAKGLVFKLRVVRAGVRDEVNLPTQPTI